VSAPSLEALVVEHAATLEDAEIGGVSGAPEILVRGMPVAVVEPEGFDVHLRPAVAAAALRTPDVMASPRGLGWVRLAPAVLDGFATDRALAWLESAVALALEDELED
jgi:hypothetical protein